MVKHGMLTEENQTVRFDEYSPAKVFYTYDANQNPKEGIEYTGPFIPERSGYIYYRSRLFFRYSERQQAYITTYEDSLNQIGKQEGVLSKKTETDFGTENRFVSQEYMKSESEEDKVGGIKWGWGDTSESGGRKGISLESINNGDLGNHIIFNSITNSVIGDERNFVAARIDDGDYGKDIIWRANRIEVDPGKTYIVRLYGHNNSPKGYDAIAKNTQVQFMVPEESGRTLVVFGQIRSSNADPDRYWDSVVFTSKNKFHLEPVKGSALIESNGNVGNTTLSDEIFNEWSTVGYDSLNGEIPGCYGYAFCVTVKVRVVED